jgi:hypothetical protein
VIEAQDSVPRGVCRRRTRPQRWASAAVVSAGSLLSHALRWSSYTLECPRPLPGIPPTGKSVTFQGIIVDRPVYETERSWTVMRSSMRSGSFSKLGVVPLSGPRTLSGSRS